MKPPLSIRHITDEERAALATGRRRLDAFTLRRGQIVLASAPRQQPAGIAKTLHGAPHTVRHVLQACNARGFACVRRGSNVPLRVEPVLHAAKRAQGRAIWPQSPRTCGQPARVWPRTRLATVCDEQGLRDTTLSCPTMVDAIVRVGVSWPRATHGIVSPDPADARKKHVGTAGSRWPCTIQPSCWASQMTCGGAVTPSPSGLLGAMTRPSAWGKRRCRPRPQRAQPSPVMDAMGRQPTRGAGVWCKGRPGSGVTGAVLAWLASSVTDQGTRALWRIWDQASWHVRQTVQPWLTAHNRHAKHAGSGRMIVCRLPTNSPWLNPIEPTWVHGKRAVGEPARVLSTAALIQRVCAY
jgi:hypothetical protein